MNSPLTSAETVIGFLPALLPLAAFVVLRAKPEYGFTEAGGKYRKVDTPTHVPLLGTRTFWLLFGICLGCAAAWALTEAVASAVQFGTVSLPGRRKHPRPVVPWEFAWAYLTGLFSLLLSTVIPRLAAHGSNTRFWLKVVAVLLGIAGYLLVLLSPLLSSWQGVGGVLVVLAVVIASLWWRRRSLKHLSSAPSNDA
jgi:hypothetical protein